MSDPISALLLGGLGAYTSLSSGRNQQKDSRSAGLMAAGASRAAAKDLEALAGNTKNEIYAGAENNYRPYITPGLKATDTITNLLGLNGGEAQGAAFGNYQMSPDYQVRLNTGLDAAKAGAAAGGSLNSGAYLKDLTRFGADVGSQGYNDYFSKLTGLNNQGYNATNALNDSQIRGQGLRLGAQGAVANLMAGAGGQEAQGFMAGQNAVTAGQQGAINSLAGGFGQAGGMSGLQSLFAAPTVGNNPVMSPATSGPMNLNAFNTGFNPQSTSMGWGIY